MKNPVDTTSNIIRYEGGTAKAIQDTIVTEYPVTIQLDGEEFATMVCTPENIEDMVIGFLASEGVIREYSDIKEIWVQEDGFVNVETKKANKLSQKFHSKRYITSCCGKSRQGFYFYNDARTAKKITEVGIRLPIESCFRLMIDMQTEATTFHATGGVHNAALCDEKGIILSRMDIGRHNALDKIYGYCLKNNISINGKVIAFSGRISSEILLKVAKIGCEIVLSKSAPTELALQLANDLGITAVGFIRNSSCNIYTHPERIVT
ncbi:formate dehydrogenase accessory sulfurtransferase FdhD [Aneurinibacillus sp. Ricciae_BoGa-3]|uniref:formate dehydrogenase accessory sulfurtransferase FdhD n=1 Tax=Aneurinibacillus sp. Ricciae_BoGa-3 TaxID=3022697 RepID=UPI00233FB8A7|nr:formate dehydrogenase accessory sulfurtransferase FdhD [Aneurinibacillus sp. Ricciae_BoGa-3]WCK55476.1 formate dehydrogenase accessory sulfurtransferase FdhD [Aneurinibacillus sp. Ricciae_BoGa-3]